MFARWSGGMVLSPDCAQNRTLTNAGEPPETGLLVWLCLHPFSMTRSVFKQRLHTLSLYLVKYFYLS